MGEVVRNGRGREGGGLEAAAESEVVADVETFQGRSGSGQVQSDQEVRRRQTGSDPVGSGQVGSSSAGEGEGSIGGPRRGRVRGRGADHRR